MKPRRLILFVSLMSLSICLFPLPGYSAWEVAVQVSIPDPASDSGLATNKLTFGMNDKATDDFDNQWDVLALTSSTLNAHFLHPEYPQEKTHLWKDLRKNPTSEQWEVEVSSPLTGQMAVTWNPADIPGNVDLRILDGQTGNLIDMKGVNSISFNNTSSSVHKLTIQAAEKSGADPGGSQGGNLGADPGGSSGGGGGCGYIKGAGGKNSDGHGQAALNMAILMLPLLFPMLRNTRGCAFFSLIGRISS